MQSRNSSSVYEDDLLDSYRTRSEDDAFGRLTRHLHSFQFPTKPEAAKITQVPALMADNGAGGRERGDSVSSTQLDDQGLSDSGTQELSQVVDDLLAQLSTKFSSISSELLSKSEMRVLGFTMDLLTEKVDDMSRRLDNLEAKVMQGDRGSGEQSK